MTKIIDFNKTVYELVKQYPQIEDIMVNLGFTEIKNKVMLNSVGKLMTISKGAKMKKIDLQKIVEAFQTEGFQVINFQKEENLENSQNTKLSSNQRTELLKSYLTRLNAGEDLQEVKKDFVANFSNIDASEIMKAEQELIQSGAPVDKVQKLCDIHSALFHKQIDESNNKQEDSDNTSTKQDERTKELVSTKGHLLYTLTEENKAIENLVDKIKEKSSLQIDVNEDLKQLKQLSIHYTKKADLLYPMLKVKYGIAGPSDVMWGVDYEIRSQISKLIKEDNHDENWLQKLTDTLTRIKEMVYKENNILFVLCAEHFTKEDWVQLYWDGKDYDVCLGVSQELWLEAEQSKDTNEPVYENQQINLPGGHFTLQQLRAVLNTIPMEITFIDENNINCFFNEGKKVFKRPSSAIGREVFACHPVKVEPVVRKILNEFRQGTKDKFPIWMEKNGRAVLVTYMAVRDLNNKYLGAMELVQDMEDAKKRFQL